MRRADSSNSGEGGGNTSTSIVPCAACSTAIEPRDTPIACAISSGISIIQLSPALWGMSSLLIRLYLFVSAHLPHRLVSLMVQLSRLVAVPDRRVPLATGRPSTG